MTHKHCFNRKFRKGRDESNSLEEISRLTDIPLKRLEAVYEKVLRETKGVARAWGVTYHYALTH